MAAALILQLLAWEIPYAMSAALKRKKKKKEMAHGDSQARGLIGAVAAGFCQRHSNAGSKPILRPIPQLTAMLDP